MDTNSLQKEYEQVAARGDRLKGALVQELGHLLAHKNITLGVPIEARVKGWDSIEEKITRKSLVLKKITDLDDLVGLRMILLFRRDLELVDRMLRETLTILSAEDTALRLAETQFGYQSQHYVVEVPVDWLKIPSYEEFGGIRVEVQVRTLAQHIWAAASHKLQYKHEASVPLPLRRSIHRASALLETVDIEFDRLLHERSVYVKDQLESSHPDELLNVEIVRSVLTELLPAANKRNEEQYDELLSDLNVFDVKTASRLRAILKKNMGAILAEEKKTSEEQKVKFYFTHVGLSRNGLRFEFGDVVRDYFLSKANQRVSRKLEANRKTAKLRRKK